MIQSKYYYVGMFRKFLFFLTVFAAFAGAGRGIADIPAEEESNIGAERTILLFGASWCAPCIAEVRNIAELAKAAEPDRLVIVWSDSGIKRIVFRDYDNVEIATGARKRRLLDRYTSQGAGLPYTVVTDARERKCGEWRAPLTPDAVARLRAACNRP